LYKKQHPWADFFPVGKIFCFLCLISLKPRG
jgi:hypothetical protein